MSGGSDSEYLRAFIGKMSYDWDKNKLGDLGKRAKLVALAQNILDIECPITGEEKIVILRNYWRTFSTFDPDLCVDYMFVVYPQCPVMDKLRDSLPEGTFVPPRDTRYTGRFGDEYSSEDITVKKFKPS